MKKIAFLLAFLFLSTAAQADYRYNPYTGKLDYYEKTDLTAYLTSATAALTYVPFLNAEKDVRFGSDTEGYTVIDGVYGGIVQTGSSGYVQNILSETQFYTAGNGSIDIGYDGNINQSAAYAHNDLVDTYFYGNNGNASFTLIRLDNTHVPLTGQTGTTNDLVFNLTQKIGSVVSLHEAAKISAYKVSDWFHATTEDDTDSGLKFYVTNAGTPTLALTIDNAGDLTLAGNIYMIGHTLHVDNISSDGENFSFDSGSAFMQFISTGGISLDGGTDPVTIVSPLQVNDNLTMGNIAPRYSESTITIDGQTGAITQSDPSDAIENTFGKTNYVSGAGSILTMGYNGELVQPLRDGLATPNQFGMTDIYGYADIYIGSTFGTEKITNGTFTGASTGWTLPAGWAYSSNTVVKNGDGTGSLEQTVANMVTAPVTGEVYLITGTVSTLSGGVVSVTFAGTGFGTKSTTGAFSFFGRATNATGSLLITPSVTGVRCTIDDVSVKRVADGTLFVGGAANVGSLRSNAYASSDGSAGVTVTTCTSFKNGLCVAGT